MIEKIKNNLFLFGTIVIYIVLFIVNMEKAIVAIGNTGYYLKEMLVIMPVVFLLTALIDAWIPQKMIMNSLGENSGIKGSFIALALGSISAGPIYAAFPVAKTLLKKGASVDNIVVILSSWAVIKIPMLANEVKFLGPKFMIARWILTVLAIFIMGYITSKLVKPDSIPLEKEKLNEGELKVDKVSCIGCGICVKIAPDYFSIDDYKGKKIAIPKTNYAKSEDMKKLIESKEKCPMKSIRIGELSSENSPIKNKP